MPTYHASTNTVNDFGRGNEVLYLPMWVNEDASHPDCETGVVHSMAGDFVFVQFYDKETGDIDPQPKSCNPKHLINMIEA